MFEAKIIIDQNGKKTVSLEMDVWTLSQLHSSEIRTFMEEEKNGLKHSAKLSHKRLEIMWNAMVDADFFQDMEGVTKYDI